jgi:hypothetical protein
MNVYCKKLKTWIQGVLKLGQVQKSSLRFENLI